MLMERQAVQGRRDERVGIATVLIIFARKNANFRLESSIGLAQLRVPLGVGATYLQLKISRISPQNRLFCAENGRFGRLAQATGNLPTT